MFQIRIHGRGGQGVVTAAELLAVAAFDQGRYAQAFPSFGSERMGAPVVSYCRIDEKPIRTREPVMEPDALIVQDVSLIHQVDLFSGISPAGYLLVNTSRTFEELGLGSVSGRLPAAHLANCPATDIALEQLGRPVPNAALIAGFAALTGLLSLDSVDQAIRQRFPGAVGERNVAAATAAFRYVTNAILENASAAPD